MRLSWVIKKGKLHSCHQGKWKCHLNLVMTFSHNEKCDHYVFLRQRLVPKLSGVTFTVLCFVLRLAEVKTASVMIHLSEMQFNLNCFVKSVEQKP